MAPSTSTEPFRSFWQAGYEGARIIDASGQMPLWSDPTQHIAHAAEDYALLHGFGIRTVREILSWSAIDRNGHVDFSSIEPLATAARANGIQVIWTLCRHAWPEDLDPNAPPFVERFARYCEAVARFLAPYSDAPPVYCPIDDISLICLAATERRSGRDSAAEDGAARLKRQLVRAAIVGCDAILRVAPNARLLHCDPLIHVAASEEEGRAAAGHQAQFGVWDMLCGRQDPELGGAERYLDLIGVSYYHGNQWEAGTNEALPWHLDDPRRRPLRDLLAEVHRRYRRPISIAETSHVGRSRGAWIREVAQEAVMAVEQGVQLLGICLFPIIDRPDWDAAGRWHFSGLWDVRREGEEACRRVLSQSYAASLRHAQRITGRLLRRHEAAGRQEARMPTLIVFSHLRWNFVYRRPQHLLTRLAECYPVLFIEEPVYDERETGWECSYPAPNVTVCRPHTKVAKPGFHDGQLPQLRMLMRQLLVDCGEHIVWCYSPMALPLVQECRPELLVYDCMDDLSAFKGTPRQLVQREHALLRKADLVFAGGPSLYASKRVRHPNVHCFPGSVDAMHFEQALDRTNSHPAHKDIPGPRLGYYGVIDERFDAQLIAHAADAHPQWQIVLVGPIVGIDPASLPRRPNIHYLGRQPYKTLPYFLAGWDICLLPFAHNAAARFLNPSRTLEYMAAELPIVSTPVKDVADMYADIVYIAADANEFVAVCEAALLETIEQRALKLEKMRAAVAATSWDRTAHGMHELMQQALAMKRMAAEDEEELPVPTMPPQAAGAALNMTLKAEPITRPVRGA